MVWLLAPMIRQQSGHAAQPSMSTARHVGCNDVAAYNTLKKALEFLTRARDTSVIESKHSVFVQSKLAFNTRMHMQNSTIPLAASYQSKLLELYISAAVNSMNVILQDMSGSLLGHIKATDIMGHLCSEVAQYIVEALKSQPAEEGVRKQIVAAGLPAVLTRFTEAAWQWVQQLSSNHCQAQQQQQQEQRQKHAKHKPAPKSQQQHFDDVKVRCSEAYSLIGSLLVLWQELSCLAHSTGCPALSTTVVEALPLLIKLTTGTAAALKQALDAASSGSSNSSLVRPFANQAARFFAARGIAVAAYSTNNTQKIQAQQEAQNAEQQWQQLPQQHIFFADKMPELLLQLLAHQAGQLHAVYDGVSEQWQGHCPATATATATAAAGTGQRQQQQQQFGGCVVPSSHLQLLQLVGLGYGATVGPSDYDVPDMVHHYGVTLSTLAMMVKARHWRATHSEHSTSSGPQGASQQQQQQQQREAAGGDVSSVLPSRLLVAAIKVLIEVVLLLPAGESLPVYADSLELILLLLHTAFTPTAAAAAAATGQEELQRGLAWPVIPAAVAAGLLQPVVAQLSQAVMCCLLQTDHLQQQQEQKAMRQAVADGRLVLLHCYGSLLIIVCQSVEPKHLATVLQSQSPPDLLITLAAIEAIIRAEACQLAPKGWKLQQQQQLQAEPHRAVCSFTHRTNSPNNAVQDGLQQPQHQVALTLVPLALKLTLALLKLVTEPSHHSQWLATPANSGPNALLRARLFTILNTVLTLCRAAVDGMIIKATSGAVAATQYAARHPQLIKEALMLAPAILDIGMKWQAWQMECCITSRGVINVLPIVLLSRAAASIWSSGLCQVPRTLSSALVPLAESVTDITITLQCLAALAAQPSMHEGAAAAVSKQATTHEDETITDHVAIQQQQQQPAQECAGILTLTRRPGLDRLTQLLRQSLILKSTAVQLGVCSPAPVQADAPEAALCNLQHVAVNLQQLCGALSAEFPLRYCCNNPLCINLTKLSEWQLVCGKACICAGCGVARCCSKGCQVQHRKLHKPVCHALNTQVK